MHLRGRHEGAASRVLVVGSTFLDCLVEAGSLPARAERTARRQHGGVARNVAEGLGWLGVNVELVTLLTPDVIGAEIAARLTRAGVALAGRLVPGGVGRFIGVLGQDGEVTRTQLIQPPLGALDWTFVGERFSTGVRCLIVETGLDPQMLDAAVTHAENAGIMTVALPTRLNEVQPNRGLLRRFRCMILNQGELVKIFGHTAAEPQTGIRRMHEDGIDWAVVTLGPAGVLVGIKEQAIKHFPSEATEVVTTLGAGDAFAAGFIGGMIVLRDVERAARAGLEMSRRNLATTDSARSEPADDILFTTC